MEGLLSWFKSMNDGDLLLVAVVIGVVVLAVLQKGSQKAEAAEGIGWAMMGLAIVGVMLAGALGLFFLAALIKGALIILYTPIPGW